MTKAPFVGESERASELLGLVHTDVCGLMNSAVRACFHYFINFTNDLSWYGYIYLMRNKAESFKKFKEFQNEVQNHTSKKIKFLRLDHRGEYLSHEFSDHLKNCGIIPQLWGYALETAAFTLNHVPSKSVEKTPYEIWTGKCPSLSFLKIWSCDAYVKHLTPTKLEPRSYKCIFVGYPRKTKHIISTIVKRTKCLLLLMWSFLRKSFSQKKLVGAQCDSKMFEKHKKMFQFPLTRRCSKMSQRSSLTNMLNPNHEDQNGHVAHLKSTCYKLRGSVISCCWTTKSLTLTQRR